MSDIAEAECCATCEYRGEENEHDSWTLECAKHHSSRAVWMKCEDYKYDGMHDGVENSCGRV
jgi:hypothetical protein